MCRGFLVARVVSAACLTLLAACSVPQLDDADKDCPCAVGWTCDPSTNRCVYGALPSSTPAGNAAALPPERDRNASPEDAGTPAPEAGPAARDTVPPPVEAGSAETPSSDAGAGDAAMAHSPHRDAQQPLDASQPDASADADTLDAAGPEVSDAAEPEAGADAGLDLDTCRPPESEPVLWDGFEPDHRGFAQGGSVGSTSVNRAYPFPYSGTQALRVRTAYPTIGARVSHTLEQSMTEGRLYASVYLFVDESVRPVSFSTLTLTNASNQGIRLLYTRDGLSLQVDSAETSLALDPVVQTIGRWVKVEVALELGAEGEVAVCLDDVEALRQPLSTSVAGGYTSVKLGIVRTDPDEDNVVLYADDFALHHEPPPLAP